MNPLLFSVVSYLLSFISNIIGRGVASVQNSASQIQACMKERNLTILLFVPGRGKAVHLRAWFNSTEGKVDLYLIDSIREYSISFHKQPLTSPGAVETVTVCFFNVYYHSQSLVCFP